MKRGKEDTFLNLEILANWVSYTLTFLSGVAMRPATNLEPGWWQPRRLRSVACSRRWATSCRAPVARSRSRATGSTPPPSPGPSKQAPLTKGGKNSSYSSLKLTSTLARREFVVWPHALNDLCSFTDNKGLTGLPDNNPFEFWFLILLLDYYWARILTMKLIWTNKKVIEGKFSAFI